MAAYTGISDPRRSTSRGPLDVSTTSSRRTPSVTTSPWATGRCRTGPTSPVRRHAWTPSSAVTTRRAGVRRRRRPHLQRARRLRDRASAGHLRRHRGDDQRSVGQGHHVVVRAAPVDRAEGRPTSHRSPTSPSDCTLLDCEFDSSDSVDLDGTITSYDWDFGDGSTSDEANPAHSYARRAPTTSTLTVTDDDGRLRRADHQGRGAGRGDQSPVAYVGSAAAQASNDEPAGRRAGGGRGRRPATARAEPQQHVADVTAPTASPAGPG